MAVLSEVLTDRPRSYNRRRQQANPSAGRQPAAVPTVDGDAAAAPEARWSPLVIRLALARDENALRRLAHLDSARPLAGQALLAEQGSVLLAAISLEDGRAVADPFVASAVIIAMLTLRAEQLGRPLAATAA